MIVREWNRAEQGALAQSQMEKRRKDKVKFERLYSVQFATPSLYAILYNRTIAIPDPSLPTAANQYRLLLFLVTIVCAYIRGRHLQDHPSAHLCSSPSSISWSFVPNDVLLSRTSPRPVINASMYQSRIPVDTLRVVPMRQYGGNGKSM